MTQDATQPILTAVFVDYDNIYLSLKKRSDEAAKRFAKDAVSWIREIESGRLITATNTPPLGRQRRIVVNRCYGNPVPRRNPQDNSTDMTSFPFVRHHFLRAGFEVIDCPPLTAQLKNSSDIKMVMDATDFLDHDTRFDEFLILSGDADFTPLLHRLRAHDRRTAIFANDFTAAAYTALCDGEVKETTLLSVLLESKLVAEPERPLVATTTAAPATTALAPAAPAAIAAAQAPAPLDPSTLERTRAEIIASVVVAVKSAGGPVPLETLAERTTRALGHERTVGTGWAGASSFLELLRRHLPAEIRLTEQPPYLAYEAARAIAAPVQQPMPLVESRPQQLEPVAAQAPPAAPVVQAAPQVAAAPAFHLSTAPTSLPPAPRPARPSAPPMAPAAAAPPALPPQPSPQQRQAEMAAVIQASIARIHEACQAPPLSPPEYRGLFEALATEIADNGLQGGQTIANIHARTQQLSINVSRDDIRFVMEVVSEADPWFEQGATANLFAGRFRNYVVARCRAQSLNLSSDELDLIDAWFAGGQITPQAIRVQAPSAEITQAPAPAQPAALPPSPQPAPEAAEQFPKILRTRLRG